MSQAKFHALMASMIVAASALAATSACTKPKHDDLLFAAPDDAAEAAAEAEAVKTLPIFWSKFDAKAPGYSGFSLKARFRADDDESDEFLWVNVERKTDTGFVGKIANEPVLLGKVKLWDRVEVTADRIVDWSYVKDSKYFGHYTTRVLMKDAAPEERAFLAPTPLEVAEAN